jgi:K+-sensing histidine kinase KdpD
MNEQRAQWQVKIGKVGLRSSLASKLVSLRTHDGTGLSLDGLDAVIRTLAMLVVVVLTLFRVFWPNGERHDASEAQRYLLVAAGLVGYNLGVIAIMGVPWRRTPREGLFLFDGAVALGAISLTGGVFSPFIVLTYALVIGATLRLNGAKPVYALAGCVGILTLSALLAGSDASQTGTVLAVELTSLVMVSITAMSLRRTAEIEAERIVLEETQAFRLRQLNDLTESILSGSLDPGAVLKTVAQAAAELSHAVRTVTYLDTDAGELVRSSDDPDPVVLTPEEEALVAAAASRGQARQSAVREHGSGQETYALCVPVALGSEGRAALLAWRSGSSRFSEADVSLLSSIAQQIAGGVRLALLYEREKDRASHFQERERLERDLLSLVSHDLRTPLTAIRTCVDALSDGNGVSTPASARAELFSKLVNNIDRNADRLSSMVDDLLDMARLRSGRVTLDLSPANMGELLEDLAATALHHINTHNHEITLDLPARDGARWERLTCVVDRRRIEQVVLNLVTNAQKYAPPGTPITLGATERNGEVRIFVRDSGPGISEQEQQRIFDRFYTGPDASRNGGTATSLGLGLAIARSIVEMHGGRMWVTSRPGSGSTFSFALSTCATQAEGNTATDTFIEKNGSVKI